MPVQRKVIRVTEWKEDAESGEWKQEVSFIRDEAEVKKLEEARAREKRKNRQAVSAAEEEERKEVKRKQTLTRSPAPAPPLTLTLTLTVYLPLAPSLFHPQP